MLFPLYLILLKHSHTGMHFRENNCRYEIQEQKEVRYGIPTYTGQFRVLVTLSSTLLLYKLIYPTCASPYALTPSLRVLTHNVGYTAVQLLKSLNKKCKCRMFTFIRRRGGQITLPSIPSMVAMNFGELCKQQRKP
jgi:hypothetical protein